MNTKRTVSLLSILLFFCLPVFAETQYAVTFNETNELEDVKIEVSTDSARESQVEGSPIYTVSGGTAAIDLSDGTYYFTSSKWGRLTFKSTFTVAGSTRTVSFEMDEGYEIYYLQDLDAVRYDLTGDYFLMRDLNFEEDESYDQTDPLWQIKKSSWTGEGGTAGWDPIGVFDDASSVYTPFSGYFDGQGHTISDLYIDRGLEDKVGLFSYVDSDGEIVNLGLENVDVRGGSFVGSLVGYLMHGERIEKAYSSGTIRGANHVGGLLGSANNVNVIKSYSIGEVVADGENAGGLIGGGESLIIRNSYSMADVSGVGNVGGFLGTDYNMGSIENSFSAGQVTGTAGNVGGFLGSGGSANISNSFWDMDSSGQTESAGGVGKTTSQMKSTTTYSEVGWDIKIKEEEDLNDGYPYLAWQLNSSDAIWYISPYWISQEQKYTVTFNEKNGLSEVEINISTDPSRDNWIEDLQVYTVEGGTAAVDLVDGTYYYSAVKEGYVTYPGTFTVYGSTKTVGFTMEAEPSPFQVSVFGLSVTPEEVYINELATFTVTVENTGGQEGSYTVEFYVGGSTLAYEVENLGVGETEAVTVAYSTSTPGEYTVRVKDSEETEVLRVYEYPSVKTLDGASVYISSASLPGELTGMGLESGVTTYFRYRAQGGVEWSSTTFTFMGSTGSLSEFTGELEFNTEYEYKAVASWFTGESTGSIKTFMTKGEEPEVSTLEVEVKGSTGAVLRGELEYMGVYNEVGLYFSYWRRDPSFSTTTETVSAEAPVIFSDEITGLTPNASYYYRAFGSHNGDTVEGEPLLFWTYQLPPFLPEGWERVESDKPDRITIRWKGPEDTEFRIYRDPPGEAVEEEYSGDGGGVSVFYRALSSTSTYYEYTDKDVTASGEYIYRVYSLNSDTSNRWDANAYVEITGIAGPAERYKPLRRFITPANRQIEFGPLAAEVLITDIRGQEVARIKGEPVIFDVDKHIRCEIETGLYIYMVTTKDGDKEFGTIAVAR